MKSKIVKIINMSNDGKMAIKISDDMKFSELVQAWTFMTGFIFNICEGQGDGVNALNGGKKEREECKRIFNNVFAEWIAYSKTKK
ncbi:hypothetical protein SDC9_59726 [bioreactor metagenome]|uniref:Uncharacterized protein n=1 Tax=bioreactor metagenome TaxID=1076179 RepID=A0A644XB80_9ZZZZ